MSRVKLFAGLAVSLALVVGLVVSLLGGGGSPSASSTQTAAPGDQKPFFGIIQGIRLDQQDFETMAATGVGSDRFLLNWGLVQPKQGDSFNWGPTDALIGSFASHGIRLAPFVWGSPPWVADNTAQPPLDTPQDMGAWQNFLGAAVARYGSGGSFWSDVYSKRYPDATPLPIRDWQIWNEPNLKKYFAPKPSVDGYAKLLQLASSAIRSQDPKASIVLAGMPGYGEVDAWDFLNSLYSVAGFKNDFDAAALHPYASNVDQLRSEIEKVRGVMATHGDQEKPLWLTELGWGSGPPNRFGLSKGVAGQEKLLKGSYKLVLSHRKAWKVQRVFWFDWRDPSATGAVKCSFCNSAGLLKYNRDPKPAYYTFKRFATAR